MLEIWANIEDDAEIISVEVIELLERVQDGMDGMVVAEEGEVGGDRQSCQRGIYFFDFL